MGIDKRLTKLWKTRREDVLTTCNVLTELGLAKQECVAEIFDLLDRFVAADRKEEMNSV